MRILFLLLTLALIALFSCSPARKKTEIASPAQKPPRISLPDSATITVEKENVRLSPNGELWGSISKNDKIEIIRRMGNWINFHSSEYDSAFVWAPSAGFKYFNLYHPATYFDTTHGEFHPIDYFRELFGDSGVKRQDLSSEYEIFFNEIGLGSHKETVLEVATTTSAQVKHGVTLFVSQKTDRIFKVKVDFFQPINGLANTIQKCNLPKLPPSEENPGHVIWKAGAMFENLEVDLERKEWNGDQFSSIWFDKKETAGEKNEQ